MPVWPPWHTRTRKSANGSVCEHDLQLAEHQIPVLASGVPVLHDALGGQIQHPAQGVVVREGGLVLRDLPELAVQTLDDVRRVYDFPNLRVCPKFCVNTEMRCK